MSKAPKRYTPEIRTQAIELYRRGTPITEISACVGAPTPTIYLWAHDAGVQRSRSCLRAPTRRHAPDPRALGLELYEQDVPIAEISSRVGAPAPTIYSWAQTAGITRNATRRPRRQAIDPQIKAKALALYASGVPLQRIAEETGLHEKRASKWARRDGAIVTARQHALNEMRASRVCTADKNRQQVRGRREERERRRLRALELHTAGVKIVHIARSLHVPEGTVHSWLRRERLRQRITPRLDN